MGDRAADVPIVAFVGRSGCGKTTLITRLVQALSKRCICAAVVKHSPIHEVETDVKGTDTWRFWEAGARHVTLVARDRTVHSHRFDDEPELQRALDGVHGVDVILLEGYKRSSVPKVEVIRQACDPQPIPGVVQRIACVTDVVGIEGSVPVFGLDEVEALVGFLVERLGLSRW